MRHRAPATYMSFLGAEWLERPDRVREEQPERVLDTLGIRPGDVVADVGCGSGYYARRAAARVRPGGMVYCEDIQFEMIEIAKGHAAAEGIEGIIPVLGTATDPMLPEGEIDWVIIADVYHEMSHPEPMLAGIRRALAPGGRVALLEYRVEDGTGDWIKADHRMSVRQVLSEWQVAGFELEALYDFLPSQHLFLFRSSDSSRSESMLPQHDLVDAVDAGIVDVETVGSGNAAVTVRIRREHPHPILITSSVGTHFRSDGEAADMIARRDGWVVLADDGVREWSIRAVPRQPDRNAPGSNEVLTLFPPNVAPDLEELLHRLQSGTYTGIEMDDVVYAPLTLGVEQAAVWITDADPSYRAIADEVGGHRMPAAYAVAFALVFVDRAGIDVTALRVWSDRAMIFRSVRDPNLSAWYQAVRTR